MDDLISRQAAINAIENMKPYHQDADDVAEMIQNMPSADAVEVVRCKDCKWFNDIGCSIRIVDDSDKPTENDYCSFGERKDG